MSQGEWSRSDKIGLLALVVTVISCIAAIIVVPEVRRWIGLETSEAFTKNGDITPKNDSRKEGDNKSETDVVKENHTGDSKIAGIGFAPNDQGKDPDVSGLIEVKQSSFLMAKFRVQPIDIALYQGGKVYIKLSICNTGLNREEIHRLFVWYTPQSGQDSINWDMRGEPDKFLFLDVGNYEHLADLKPSECCVVGSESQNSIQGGSFARPLGKLHISRHIGSPEVSIDLALADSRGFVRY